MIKEFFGISEVALKNGEWIGFAVLFSFAASRIFRKVLQQYISRQKFASADLDIKKHFKRAPFWFLLTGSLKGILPLLSLEAVMRGKAHFSLNLALICSVTWMLTKTVNFLKKIIDSRFEIHNPNNLKERKVRTQVQFVEKLILIFVYVVAASFILMNFDGVKEIGRSLIASAGLAGITLGFAAQKSLTNLLAGFQIAFTQPIRIDDVVIVEGEWGKIEEITLTYVVVRVWDKRTLIVPITYFLEKPFQNWTRASADIIGSVFLYLDYTVSVNDLRREFCRWLNACDLWDRKVQAVQVTNSTEHAIEVRFLMSARNASDAFDLRCLVREHMIVYLKSHYPNCFPQHRVRGFETQKDQISYQPMQSMAGVLAFDSQ